MDHGDTSLFAWVVDQCRSGWLLCDDGNGEVADFLHLTGGGQLTAIHVKASGSTSTGRQISLVPFEQPVSQATKNKGLMEREPLGAAGRPEQTLVGDVARRCASDGGGFPGRARSAPARHTHPCQARPTAPVRGRAPTCEGAHHRGPWNRAGVPAAPAEKAKPSAGSPSPPTLTTHLQHHTGQRGAPHAGQLLRYLDTQPDVEGLHSRQAHSRKRLFEAGVLPGRKAKRDLQSASLKHCRPIGNGCDTPGFNGI